MGAIHGFCASSHARAICAVVAPLRSATLLSRSSSRWFACRASSANRGIVARMSPSLNEVDASMVPVRKPLPSGL